ncbi:MULTISPECIES: hypothetical protein [unclassified Sphingomonas]|uniref:hypothetical protein n=1 Tax=unclassified Sphingomonas TaxID=196159 RepID=UPI0006FA498A|nr:MULTISPECIES: hypothetical protein [unclassified Sphingomonas]KQX19376.1 hypothetical protein ASD17_12605 [Sphingomonas sp. Root1294]KQY65579.1 hypothetical protein ASD39_15805 [Sphingomonas sp. Root50]KRB95120.1 hypothetical protein ASE22_04250 [Sphingomonas sp. Root720]
MAIKIERLVEKGGNYYWQPSKSLRDMGWLAEKLGRSLAGAIERANKLNQDVEIWKKGGAQPVNVERKPERATMAYAIRRYRAEDLASKAKSTRATYGSYLGMIEQWADEGRTPIRLIDRGRCVVLKDALLKPPELGAFEVNGRKLRAAGIDDDRTALWLAHHAGVDAAIALLTAPPLAWAKDVAPEILKKAALEALHGERIYRVRVLAGREARPKLHRANGLLSVLKSLMTFAKDKDMIDANPMAEVTIPEAPPRQQTIPAIAREAIGAIAAEKGWHGIKLAIDLGFGIMQREGDLLRLTTKAYRQLEEHEIPAEARANLMAADGTVMGIDILQKKTKKWIAVPVVGELRTDIEAAIAAARAAQVATLHPPILRDEETGEAWPQWKLQRRFRACVAAASERAAEAGDIELANALADIVFQDLRRTGMVHLFELGVPDHFIAAMSGHTIERTKKILEVYGPRNTRMAVSGVAMAVSQLKVRAKAQAKRDGEQEQQA